MLTLVNKVKAFLATPTGKVVGKVISVFLAAAVATLVASGLDLAHVTDMALYQKAALAGWAAVLQLLGSLTVGGTKAVKARRDALHGLGD